MTSTRPDGGPLKGIIAPLVTPLESRDRLDAGGLECLIEHVLAGGVSGLYILGTSGEGPSLGMALRREMIERTCRQVRGRIPVLVGITDTAFSEALLLARHAAHAEAKAVVYAGPCYFQVSQRELLEHVTRLADEAPLPLFLYNIPGHTRTTFAIETVFRLAENGKAVGLKDSSGDMHYLHRLRAGLGPQFTVLVGPEELLAEAVLMGVHGGVNGGANLFPELYVRLYHAASSGRLLETRELHEQVIRISEAVYQPFGYLKGLKCALRLLSICNDVLAEPHAQLSDEQRQTISARLRASGNMKR